MNEIDEIAHIIQLSIAPVFLLTGVGTLLNVLSGRLARIIDRARVLEQRLETPELPRSAATLHELRVLVRRGKLINQSIKISTISALLACFLIAALFASSMLHYSTHLIVSGFFVAVMLTCIVSLGLFLREVYFWPFDACGDQLASLGFLRVNRYRKSQLRNKALEEKDPDSQCT